MILYEFEVRGILEEYGIPVERAVVVDEAGVDKLPELLSEISGPYVVKAQVRGWGRGRAGLVRFANSVEEAVELAKGMLGREFGGERVKRVMVSERVWPLRELYLSFMVTGSPPGVVLLASEAGGVEVEREAVGKLLTIRVDPHAGLRDYAVRRGIKRLGLPPEAGGLVRAMYRALWDYSLLLLELNPLAVTEEGLVAIDRKAIADEDSGNSRLSEFIARHEAEVGELQWTAKKWGFSAVPLDGDVAIVGNGAGLTMATLDALVDSGGRPGLFLDLGGGASVERVQGALRLALSQPRIAKVLVNVLGGITRCDEVARGVVEALREAGAGKRIVVRLSGFMEEEGWRILEGAGIRAFQTMEEAVAEVVR